MKIFRSSNNRIYQLADIEKIKSWDAEIPIIFINYIRDKQLSTYPKSIRSNIESYLNDVLEKIAIPKLIDSLNSPEKEKRLNITQRLHNISESNPDSLKMAIPHIEKRKNDPDKEISDILERILINYTKAQKRKKTAEKRKVLRKLRQKMDKLDVDLAEGKISDNDYLTEQKKFLLLKREIDLEES